MGHNLQNAGMTPDARSYNILIKGYARAGLLSLLPDLVADMQMEVAYLTRSFRSTPGLTPALHLPATSLTASARGGVCSAKRTGQRRGVMIQNFLQLRIDVCRACS